MQKKFKRSHFLSTQFFDEISQKNQKKHILVLPSSENRAPEAFLTITLDYHDKLVPVSVELRERFTQLKTRSEDIEELKYWEEYNLFFFNFCIFMARVMQGNEPSCRNLLNDKMKKVMECVGSIEATYFAKDLTPSEIEEFKKEGFHKMMRNLEGVINDYLKSAAGCIATADEKSAKTSEKKTKAEETTATTKNI